MTKPETTSTHGQRLPFLTQARRKLPRRPGFGAVKINEKPIGNCNDIQAPNVRSLMVLAVTAALMWTLHVAYNSQNYIFIPSTDVYPIFSAQENLSFSILFTQFPLENLEDIQNFPEMTQGNTLLPHSPSNPSVATPSTVKRSYSYKLWFGLRVPSTWLLSFPRSGNTWTRYLLEAATGVVTGSVYHSKYLKGLGYMGEDDPLWWRTSLVIKTHSLLPLRIHPDYPVIAIIRNPARSILSFWNYWNIEADSQKFTGSIDYSYYLTPEFHEFAYIKLQKWRATYEYVLKNTTKLHVVFYEKLRESPIKEVRKMLNFLGVKPDEDRLACLSRHTEGRVKGAQKESDPYSLHEKMNMFSVVQAINSLLKERGFTDLPDYEF
nr:WSC domain-containing protein 1-like [Penaeus vannamei]